MRRMYSQKQIEALAKQVADFEIQTGGQSILEAISLYYYDAGWLAEEQNGIPVFKVDGDGNKDFDIIMTSSDDAGKFVAIDEDGNPELVDAPSGGTKLYKHRITMNVDDGDWGVIDATIEFVCNSNDNSTTIAGISTLLSSIYPYFAIHFIESENFCNGYISRVEELTSSSWSFSVIDSTFMASWNGVPQTLVITHNVTEL